VTEGRRHVLIAGGIGVTPILAMARQLAADGKEFSVHFCARSPLNAPCLDELTAICGSRLVTWFSSQGRRFDVKLLGAPEPGTHVYTCGPQRLLDAVRARAAELGWPEEQLHAEVFHPILDENFAPEPFDALIASSGKVLCVPAHLSLLQVLREHKILVSSSCELGVCGTCECGFTEGVVIHRDAVLKPAARKHRMMPCVSRARGCVTLDL
jgi:ferredoxin-NADP reductase